LTKIGNGGLIESSDSGTRRCDSNRQELGVVVDVVVGDVLVVAGMVVELVDVGEVAGTVEVVDGSSVVVVDGGSVVVVDGGSVVVVVVVGGASTPTSSCAKSAHATG